MNAKLCHNPQRNFTELVTDIDGDISRQRVVVTEHSVTLYTKDGSVEFIKPLPKFKGAGSGGGGLGDAVSPMPGVIEKVAVQEGVAVEAGDPLVVMIAMKMEYVIKVSRHVVYHSGLTLSFLYYVEFLLRRQSLVLSRKSTPSSETLWRRERFWCRLRRMTANMYSMVSSIQGYVGRSIRSM